MGVARPRESRRSRPCEGFGISFARGLFWAFSKRAAGADHWSQASCSFDIASTVS